MGKRTFNTDRQRPGARRGFTLVESIIASALLSVTVVAVSGAISASYAQDQYAADRAAALKSGTQLLNEVSALPLDAASAANPSIMKYASYTDEAAIGTLRSVVDGVAQAVVVEDEPENRREAKRTVTVERKTSLNGASSSTGDFAIVGVNVKNGTQTVKLKRLVTSAESSATR